MRKRERQNKLKKQKRKLVAVTSGKVSKAYAIRRYKNPDEFEYLGSNGIWGRREERRKFDSREAAVKQARAYTNVGVHAKVVPYGKDNEDE